MTSASATIIKMSDLSSCYSNALVKLMLNIRYCTFGYIRESKKECNTFARVMLTV